MENKTIELEVLDCIKIKVTETPKPKRPVALDFGTPSFEFRKNPVSSVSGIDTKVYLAEPEGDYKRKLKEASGFVYFGERQDVQGVSFRKRLEARNCSTDPENTGLGGTMVFILLDGIDAVEKLLGQKRRLVLEFTNRDGKAVLLVDKIVRFDNHSSWGVAVDDIVLEAAINFTEIKDNRKCHTQE